jgi:hypothetical protein
LAGGGNQKIISLKTRSYTKGNLKMRKSVFASVKPLAMATALAAGSTVSMIAVALPGGDTSGANGVVTESVCHNPADMTIASGVRSVTTATGTCQVRTLPPTKGLVLSEPASAGGTVVDSSALVNAGGEAYETYVGGDRSGVLVLTPNRSLAVNRSVSFATGTDGSVSFELGATVQPSTGLQSSWLTGTYSVMHRVHDFQDVTTSLQQSAYASPNRALGERNYTNDVSLTFNGDGTCSYSWDNHNTFMLRKDPLLPSLGEMDNGCTVGGGACGQNDGSNYVGMAPIAQGQNGLQVDFYDWGDANSDQKYGVDGGCTYSTASGVVTVNYTANFMDDTQTPPANLASTTSWSVDYDVSADLRYLVASEPGTEKHLGGYTGESQGSIAVGVRTGAGDVEGKTYVVNGTNATYSFASPTTASYENPYSPTYQEEECATRGSLEFSSTDAGGGFKECTLTTVSSCAGRSTSGYEETTDGGADGTIVDALTVADGADTNSACRWNTTGGLTVEVDTTDPESNPLTVTYTGNVSDNGEALVLQGAATVAATPAGDVDNPPALTPQKYSVGNFLIGQEYQGSLAGDADSDTTNNFDEIVWAADVTPPSGATNNDYNKDNTSDVVLRGASTWRMFLMANGVQSSNNALGLYGTGWDLVSSEDFDADGDTDILLRNPTSGAWRMFIIENGAVVSNSAFGAYASTQWDLAAVADMNADGTKDVLLKSNTGGGWRTFLVSAGATSSNVSYGAYATGWDFAAAADFDADGDADVLLKKTGGGGWRIFTTAAGGTSANAALALYANNWNLVSVADMDGDGDPDIVGRSTTDNTWRTFLIQSNAVASNVGTGLYTSAQWVVDTATDVNADGDADLIMRDTTTGGWRLFNITTGAASSNTVIGLYGNTAWVTSDVNDYNADGTDDIMLRNTSTNDWRSFTIVNGAVSANASPGLYVSAAWAMQK